jgi:hypothetical protein
MLHQPLLVREHLMHLALGSVLADEPVATNGAGVLLAGQPNDLGRLSLDALNLTRADLGMSDNFQEAHDFSSPLSEASATAGFWHRAEEP